ncbi:MAG TPA: hypothetical protein VN612_05585 [Acidobacteriaceae bacterium]|nr:hypothetical protein [Acidobacteriaceae bacterium]
MSGFYDAGPLEQIAINLFHGWGYNFYRLENQLRADDQLVRSKAAWLLGLAASAIAAAETDYRREFLPPPSRAKPFADEAAVAAAQKLERLHRDVCAVESHLQQLPAPENDRMTQRYRQEAPTLKTLINYDQLLIGQCDLLRTLVTEQNGTAVLEKAPQIEEGLKAIRATLISREAVLHS